ncbi:hypothetical protein GCM10027063_29530 [Promicromonospora xylanilytica]
MWFPSLVIGRITARGGLAHNLGIGQTFANTHPAMRKMARSRCLPRSSVVAAAGPHGYVASDRTVSIVSASVAPLSSR